MIKKLLSVVVLVLAINFLFAAGGVGFLVATGKLDKEKVHAIREILTPATQPATSQPSTQPAQELPPQTPSMRLDDAVSKAMGKRAGEQIELQQISFDLQNSGIERRMREIEDQQRMLDQAKADFEKQRKDLLATEARLKAAEEKQKKLDADKGFQETLAIYQALPAKKTKEIFLTLDDDTVVRYLQAMEPDMVGGILKEFKRPEEVSRAQTLLEKMRLAKVDVADSSK